MPAAAARPYHSAGLDKIGRDAASLGEHEPVPVLRPRHGLGGLTQPEDGLVIVTLAADAAGQANPEIIGCQSIALLGPLLRTRSRTRQFFLRRGIVIQREFREFDLGSPGRLAQRTWRNHCFATPSSWATPEPVR